MPFQTLFWQRRAASLPPAVRKRYARELERAERIDLLVGRLIDAWRRVRAALARGRRRKVLTAFRL